MKFILLFLFILIIIATSLTMTPHAHANACAVKLTSYTTPQFFLLSDTVFSGTVLHVDNTTDHQWKISFTVDKIWKGSSEKPLAVITNTLQGCGYYITSGEKYLVYASGYQINLNPIWTKSYADAQSDITLLDDPRFQAQADNDEKLYKKLTIAQNTLSHMTTNQSKLPINLGFVDVLNLTLVVGIDDTKKSLSAEEYQQSIKNIVGDIPIKVVFNHNVNPIFNLPPTPVSPLKQFKSGIKAEDVKCKEGLQLIFKSEDNSPACLQPETATALIQRGWAWDTTSPVPFIKKMDIIGLQKSYAIGRPIDVTVNYVGHYWNVGDPSVKILDPNGNQIWVNCCSHFAHSGAIPSLSYGDFTYHVRDSSGSLPTINETGNFIIVVSIANKTAEAKFVVIPTNQGDDKTTYHDFPNALQYSIVNTTFGVRVENDSAATKMVGFNVISPTYLPPGYQIKMIKVAKDMPLITIFASKYPLTSATTNKEFFYNDAGILITYSELSDRALKNHQLMWSDTTLKKITIGGFDAGIEGIRKGQHEGNTYDQWADLVLFKGKIIIGVRGFFSDDDLVKIASSMLDEQK